MIGGIESLSEVFMNWPSGDFENLNPPIRDSSSILIIMSNDVRFLTGLPSSFAKFCSRLFRSVVPHLSGSESEKYPKILADNPEAREIRPRGENYMSGIFKEVRAFFNWAYKTKIIDSFPFEGFEMPSERYGSPIYITLDDVQKIYTVDLSDFPLLVIQRDIFVFQCNVGCRIGGLLRLKKRDVINGAV